MQRRLARLVRRSLDGDAEAFRALFRALHGPVAAYIARRVLDPLDAEDLTARVFHRMLERLSDYDARRGHVRSWVLTMARNAVIDHLRTDKRHLEVRDAELVADASFDPNAALDRDEAAAQLRELLADVPAEVREMLAMRFGDGLRHREIAEVLGLSEAAVKQRFSRTLRELREKARAVGLQDGKGVGYAL